ncbi:hypothetical protein LP420_25865 [Massilia sp. B-10]|nr:hypothetical protein LP420_25865 [Massilia sp. B-10]
MSPDTLDGITRARKLFSRCVVHAHKALGFFHNWCDHAQQKKMPAA